METGIATKISHITDAVNGAVEFDMSFRGAAKHTCLILRWFAALLEKVNIRLYSCQQEEDQTIKALVNALKLANSSSKSGNLASFTFFYTDEKNPRTEQKAQCCIQKADGTENIDFVFTYPIIENTKKSTSLGFEKQTIYIDHFVDNTYIYDDVVIPNGSPPFYPDLQDSTPCQPISSLTAQENNINSTSKKVSIPKTTFQTLCSLAEKDYELYLDPSIRED